MKYAFLFYSFFYFLGASAQPDTTQKIVEGRRNSTEQQNKPYVILISIDGFRHDYALMHGAVYLQQVGREYTKARYMLPSFPSLTFPNHYSLVTGLYPSHHGLVDNYFYDPQRNEFYSMKNSGKVRDGRWYGGTPLWVLAEQQQMLTASFYWVGSEAAIQDTRPTYYYVYNERIPIERRIQTVVDWLNLPEERRPHFISFYFPEVDHAGHDFGPDAPKTGEAVRWVDSALQKLTDAVKTTGLDVNFILVSDHGMTNVDTSSPLRVPHVDTTRAVVAGGAELVHVHVKNKEEVSSVYRDLNKRANGYSVVLKKSLPKHLYYNKKNDVFNRIGDILLIADWPYVFAAPGARVKPGAHGYDPYKVQDMRAIFYAWGPAFKTQNVIDPLRNVDVYPLVAELLGLKYTHAIDGNRKIAAKVLQ